MIVNTTSEIYQTNVSWSAHIQAEKFCSYQSQGSKAKQVYLNTLAVSAVNSYLNLIGWSTSLEQSDSWNPVLQTMMDVADLQIPSYGKLECRVILSDQDKVAIPPEVWTERIGYVVVMLDKSLNKATLLGFMRQVNQAELPLSQLESLAKFPGYLSQQKRAATVQAANLSSWFSGALDGGWQQLNELFTPPATINFRSQSELAKLSAKKPIAEVSRVKLVQLGTDPEYTIALILNIQPQSKAEFDVSIAVCNHQFNNYLPEGLELVIVDQTNRPVMIAQANQTETIEFCFGGKVGENFSVEISLDEQFKVENFMI